MTLGILSISYSPPISATIRISPSQSCSHGWRSNCCRSDWRAIGCSRPRVPLPERRRSIAPATASERARCALTICHRSRTMGRRAVVDDGRPRLTPVRPTACLESTGTIRVLYFTRGPRRSRLPLSHLVFFNSKSEPFYICFFFCRFTRWIRLDLVMLA